MAQVDHTVLVAGASGLVGREILQRLSADKRCKTVHCLGRRPLPADLHKGLPQVHPYTVDFARPDAFPTLAGVDEVYIALGTTLAQAGSQAAFRAVDFDAVVAVAQAGIRYGATKLGVVSAMGADSNSRIFYNRVKGDMEQAVQRLGYTSVVIVRPSFLAGVREITGQPARRGEKLALTGMRLLAPLIPPNYRAVQVGDVAQGLIDQVRRGQPGAQIVLSGALQPG